jgi:hypothetical protein
MRKSMPKGENKLIEFYLNIRQVPKHKKLSQEKVAI